MSFLACCPYTVLQCCWHKVKIGVCSWWWFGRIWQHNNHKNSLLILEQKFDQCLSLFFQYNMHVWNKHFLPSNSTNAAWKELNIKCRIWPWNNMYIYYITRCTHYEWKNHCPLKTSISLSFASKAVPLVPNCNSLSYFHVLFSLDMVCMPCHSFLSFFSFFSYVYTI